MRAVLCLLAVVGLVGPGVADTYVTEGMSADTNWDVGGSPYIIVGEIWVGGHSTLTIEPGVTVRFDTDAKLTIQAESMLHAVGTAGNEIIFTSNSGTPAPDDWQSVYLLYAADYPDNSVLTHCVFEYGRYNLYCDRCHPTISFCTTRYANSAGIFCELASPQITSCNIVDNPVGIRVSGSFSFPEIHFSNLYDNGENMYVYNYDDYGEIAQIHAENNWWGVDSYLEIGNTIDIPIADAPHVEVLYDPWLHEVPVEETSWARVKAFYR